MKLKRVYKKFFNRSMPLFMVEYWWRGEHDGLKKITGGKLHFNPLFSYEPGRGVSVYYDINNQSTDAEQIINYFHQHRKKFISLSKIFTDECKQIDKLHQLKKVPIKKLLRLHLSSWPKLTMTVLMAREYRPETTNRMTKLAYLVRKKTEKNEYRSPILIQKGLKKLFPARADIIDFLRSDEIFNDTIPGNREMMLRKKGFIYFEGKIYIGTTLKKLAKKNNIILDEEKYDNSENISELKGVSAMSGRTRGIVKIVFEDDQINKVETGDILVTPMTTPNFISAMNRAAAIITDEGGITCHAAIVARELKKPCIIGTKIATRVLKDGQVVEVDADQGVVKILK